MAYKIKLPTHCDDRGKLTVIDQNIPFEVKRVFYIYDVKSERGGHRHHLSQLFLITLRGKVSVFCENGNQSETHLLDSPNEGLMVLPEDWHTMTFSEDAILSVLASQSYDKNDYIFERYP
jgi:WxcM-like, C-terminal